MCYYNNVVMIFLLIQPSRTVRSNVAAGGGGGAVLYQISRIVCTHLCGRSRASERAYVCVYVHR